MIEEYVKRVKDELDFPTQELEEKVFKIEINEDIFVTITDLDPGLLLFANICTLHKDHREELFTYLMRANLLGKGTFDSIVGLDSDEKFLTLSRSMPYEIEYPSFKQTLELFVNTLQLLREDIAKKYDEFKESIY